MTKRKWINSFGPEKVVELVKAVNDLGLYATHSREYDGRETIYHVWYEDKWLYCGPSWRLANEKYKDNLHIYYPHLG